MGCGTFLVSYGVYWYPTIPLMSLFDELRRFYSEFNNKTSQGERKSCAIEERAQIISSELF